MNEIVKGELLTAVHRHIGAAYALATVGLEALGVDAETSMQGLELAAWVLRDASKRADRARMALQRAQGDDPDVEAAAKYMQERWASLKADGSLVGERGTITALADLLGVELTISLAEDNER